ncbi:N-acetylmuramoyl-L-alanine amidase [Flavihumibacter sp. RY-1]|uniref:N-acetylmuramoyl-L-alanine amidase n=1 Tax=Flavihumibacter fluminis TaxID=2909236 RepID=A0ABS9BMP9_9BACT|nr:N-acetylmuramoyl-L-alanine amidase [Flavihumibacter fluminis]MCF1716997.1 N-acetylmuramoyl-L-alanine amidase [Flavihumibacter fluminis]
MLPYLLYLFKMLVSSAILLGYYWIFLRDQRFHQYNRYYLLGVLIISMVLPLLHFDLSFFNEGIISQTVIRTIEVISVYGEGENVEVSPVGSMLRSITILKLIYSAGIGVGFWGLGIALRRIHRMRKIYKGEQLDDITIYHTREKGTPFSFFRSVFWNDQVSLNSRAGQQIFRHELYHIRQYHSLDILFCQLAILVCWFNPFYYLIRNELRAVHEYLADQHAIGNDGPLEYAEILLERSIQEKQLALTHPFFQSQLKRRITMLTIKPFQKSGYLSRVLALPLVASLSFLLVAFVIRKPSEGGFVAKEPVTIVVDAGHGGPDPGIKLPDGQTEQQLALQISRKIASLGPDYNVKVLLTRMDESLPDNLTDPFEANKWRVLYSNSIKPALLLSVHLNGSDNNSLNGYELHVPRSNGPHQHLNASLTAAQILQNQLSPVVKVNGIKERQNKGIWVLDKSETPALLIECGFLTNPGDYEFIRETKNQETIARKILESAVLFAEHQRGNKAVQIDTVPMSKTPGKGEITFTQAEQMPFYPGGKEAWQKFLNTTLRYPQEAIDSETTGTVLLGFVVRADSTLADISIISDPGKGLGQEAKRVLEASGKWAPAKQKGQAVNCYFKQPITFHLEREF